MPLTIIDIRDSVEGRKAVQLSNACVILMTATCLHDLGWIVGTVLRDYGRA